MQGIEIDFGFPSDFIAFRFQEAGFNHSGSHILWRFCDYHQGLFALKHLSPLLDNYLGSEGYGKPLCYALLVNKKGEDFQLLKLSRGIIGASDLVRRAKFHQLLGFSDDEMDKFREESETIKNGLESGQNILEKLDSDWGSLLRARMISSLYLSR